MVSGRACSVRPFVRASVHPSVRASVRSSRTVHARVFKIPYMDSSENSWHTIFFFFFFYYCCCFSSSSSCPSYLIFWSYNPLEISEWNLMHPYLTNRACYGFEIFIWIPIGKIADPYFFSCPSYLPFWSYAPLKTSEWNLGSKIARKVFELRAWNLVSW